MKYYRADQWAHLVNLGNLGNLGKVSFLGEIDNSPRLRIYCNIYTIYEPFIFTRVQSQETGSRECFVNYYYKPLFQSSLI
ncbi:Uncharacterised protein [Sphingobacterium daejeonense]|nr:Uncharacterised protein [Sphingobacterium daejeonense]